MSGLGANGTALTVVIVYPDLLGTYGDGGNGVIIAKRAEWRGFPVELIEARSDRPLPMADIYCIGGGEDGPQVRAATMLIDDGTIVRAVESGAVVLGVCAGFQLLGESFPDASGRPHGGLGLLDVTTVKGKGKRAVGELAATVASGGPTLAGGLALPVMTGFENHGGVTIVGPEASPLGDVVAGVGNGGGDRTEGAWQGRVVGTYLHGPVLARNTALADLLLGWALAPDCGSATLSPLEGAEEEALRTERLEAVAEVGTSRDLWRRIRSRLA